MKKTENYGLNLADGTDLYNHLTVDNPNYTTIDREMAANRLSGVGKATESLTGRLHAISRPYKTPAFYMTATSDWRDGDTVSVDGQTVTMVLPDGSAPPAQVWRVNSTVLFVLVGTKLTVMADAISKDELEKKYFPFTGGTVTGATNFTGGLTAGGSDVVTQANLPDMLESEPVTILRSLGVYLKTVSVTFSGGRADVLLRDLTDGAVSKTSIGRAYVNSCNAFTESSNVKPMATILYSSTQNTDNIDTVFLYSSDTNFSGIARITVLTIIF